MIKKCILCFLILILTCSTSCKIFRHWLYGPNRSQKYSNSIEMHPLTALCQSLFSVFRVAFLKRGHKAVQPYYIELFKVTLDMRSAWKSFANYMPSFFQTLLQRKPVGRDYNRFSGLCRSPRFANRSQIFWASTEIGVLKNLFVHF